RADEGRLPAGRQRIAAEETGIGRKARVRNPGVRSGIMLPVPKRAEILRGTLDGFAKRRRVRVDVRAIALPVGGAPMPRADDCFVRYVASPALVDQDFVDQSCSPGA